MKQRFSQIRKPSREHNSTTSPEPVVLGAAFDLGSQSPGIFSDFSLLHGVKEEKKVVKYLIMKEVSFQVQVIVKKIS